MAQTSPQMSLETVELQLNGFGYYQPGYMRMASPAGGQT
jgi:hypothetical protein